MLPGVDGSKKPQPVDGSTNLVPVFERASDSRMADGGGRSDPVPIFRVWRWTPERAGGARPL